MASNFFNNLGDIQNYWNRETLIFHNQATLKSSLPSASQLISCLTGDYENGNWSDPLNVNINASKIDLDGSHEQFLSIEIDSARKLYLNGFTLCFGDLSVGIEKISSLKKQAVDFFGYRDLISITSYLSPPKAIGVLHYDRQHNFFIQREGIKRWFVSERAAIANPFENLVYTGIGQDFFDEMKTKNYQISLPRDCGKKIYELHPGDVLYVPPGFYHSPETLNDSSLHYTLTIEPACFWKDFNKDIFSKMLSSDGKFLMDYRFLTAEQKSNLITECMRHLLDSAH